MIAREISSLFTVAHMDIMRLDCDDLKRGLANKAHGYAEMLLTRLAEDHRKENERYCCWCFFYEIFGSYHGCFTSIC